MVILCINVPWIVWSYFFVSCILSLYHVEYHVMYITTFSYRVVLFHSMLYITMHSIFCIYLTLTQYVAWRA